MAAKRRRHPEEMTEEWQDPQEKLDELTDGEICDARSFRQGRYVKSAESVYEAKERRRSCEPSASERRRAAALLAGRVIAKAAQL